MRHVYLILSLVLFFSIEGFSQKINRQYSFQPQENGSLYFIHPMKGFKGQDKEAAKGLIYDITYLTAKDSVSYTFTYFSSNVLKADSVKLHDNSGKLIFANKANMYYVQPKGNNWQHRAMISIPYQLLVDIYANELPYSISIEGNKKQTYVIDSKKWNKQSKMVSKIFEVIKYNQ